MTALLVVALTAALGAVGVLLWQRPAGLLSERLKRRVIVTLKTGESFAGVLYAADREVLVLRQAEAVGAGPSESNLIVDGEALILRPDVAYMQRP